MSKADARRSKESKRALEQLEKGLRRGAAELVLEALPSVPLEAIASHSAGLEKVLRPALAAALAGRELAELRPWGALAERPELLERLGLDADELAWARLWAHVQCADFDRAVSIWKPIAARVHERAPELASAVTLLLDARGQPNSGDFPDFPRVSDAQSDRLGIELVRPRSKPASLGSPPADPAAAEDALLRYYALEPWGAFASQAQRWLLKAPLPVSSRVAVVSSELAIRELHARRGTADACAPAELVANIVAQIRTRELALSRDEEVRLEFGLILALRAVLGALSRDTTEGSHASLVLDLTRAGLRLPAWREILASAASELIARGKSPPQLDDLAPELYAAAPSAALWVRAVLALDHKTQKHFSKHGRVKAEGFDWAAQTLPAQLRDGAGLSEAFARLSAKEKGRVLDVFAYEVAPSQFGDLFDALWPRADLLLKRALASAVRGCLEGLTKSQYCAGCGFEHELELSGRGDLSEAGRKLLARLETRILPYDPLFLELALEGQTDRKAQLELLQAFISPESPIESYLLALRRAKALRANGAVAELRQRMLVRFERAPEALARGLDSALEEGGARSTTRHALAEALVHAAEVAGSQAHTELVRELLPYARRLLSRKRKTKAPLQLTLPNLEASHGTH